MRILVAEDDESVAGALCQVLRSRGHEAVAVARGSDVLLQHRDHDVLLLDLGLLDGDGFDTLRQLRQVSEMPVLIVSAQGDERSTVRGLHLGADDYLVKPVRMNELLARVDAVARRRLEPQAAAEVVRASGLEIDLRSRTVSHDGADISLTTKEFDLLAALARRPGAAVSREQILDEVWGDAFVAASRSFDVHLTQLRGKLPVGGVISTIRGFGYRLEV